jgi:hypothetical protein
MIRSCQTLTNPLDVPRDLKAAYCDLQSLWPEAGIVAHYELYFRKRTHRL